MRRNIFVFVVIVFIFVSCGTQTEVLPISSIRFTPLNFPYSNLGEFTLSESSHSEELQLFLKIFESTIATSHISESKQAENLPHTFSLQLFSGTTLVNIYRLSFDFNRDIAFLQKENIVYAIEKENFHQIMETGYFNVIFQKNHAPNAEFTLNGEKIKYSVNGSWNYETYQNKFLSYQINNQQNHSYVVNDKNFRLTCNFADKQPDQVIQTIRSGDTLYRNRILLSSEEIEIPTEENYYYYEIEAVWNNPDLPYKAALIYRFQIDVNYPPQIQFLGEKTAGNTVLALIENYDKNGKITVSSSLWEKEISLSYINQKYYGLLPIPSDTDSGEYEVIISGSGSTEILYEKQMLNIRKGKNKVRNLSRKETNQFQADRSRQQAEDDFIRQNTFGSYPEKLWATGFTAPCFKTEVYDYGMLLKYKDFEYTSTRNYYPIIENYEVFATGNAIVKSIWQHESGRYSILLDHGLGVFSIYSGLSQVSVSHGSYITGEQVIGNCGGKEPFPYFSYGLIINDVFINPKLFSENSSFLKDF